ncbi:hypothetical protein F4801DRAFT_68057 [Xylaria longipes]|nr:hypothetical protein F4801DRAFT_68057 [Xylaria longipes]
MVGPKCSHFQAAFSESRGTVTAVFYFQLFAQLQSVSRSFRKSLAELSATTHSYYLPIHPSSVHYLLYSCALVYFHILSLSLSLSCRRYRNVYSPLKKEPHLFTRRKKRRRLVMAIPRGGLACLADLANQETSLTHSLTHSMGRALRVCLHECSEIISGEPKKK